MKLRVIHWATAVALAVLVGTVVLPLLAIYFQMTHSALSGFIIGWGKPVPVDLRNLANPRRDDTLIAMAGPGMNLLLAFILMGFAKVGVMAADHGLLVGAYLASTALLLVRVNLILAFFNLLPIPPLDGSHLLKNAINMSYETYFRFAQVGFVLIILVLNFTRVGQWLGQITQASLDQLIRLYGLT